MRSAALAVLLAGCSFVGVRGPSGKIDPDTTDRRSIKCTESDVLPALDAIGGAAALLAAGGGIILEHTSDDGEPKHFTLYYAGPLVALAIVYFSSGTFGTNRISRCSELREAKSTIIPVTPIEPGAKPKKPEIEINTSP